MTATQERPTAPAPERRSGELNLREFVRWAWRQLTSMRIALILLLMLALAAVPGSLVPQERVDSLRAGQWKDAHETLTPIYEKLGLFNVYGSPWFAAIYILLVVSLIGCILPRSFVYLRGLRAQPPAAPRNLTRLPAHASYSTLEEPDVVLERARALLKSKRYRLRRDAEAGTVSAERGYLRELGNLIFHLAVLVVLVGFAAGTLFGFKGGVILVQGQPFSNNLTQYDDFVPGNLFDPDGMDPFSFTVDKFDVEWLPSGMARGFSADVDYTEEPGGPDQQYDLRVNHPLAIGGTELFLIGHGYAPVVTVRDGEGNIARSGPVPFLPSRPDLFSFGVIKAADAQPQQIGLEGVFFPTFANVNGDLVNLGGKAANPLLSLNVYTGDLGLDSGAGQSVYVLDKANLTPLPGKAGQPLRIDLVPGQTVQLPNGLGSVTFDKVVSWQRIQISSTPGKDVALLGVVLALLGLMGSLFIRSRRVWIRVRRDGQGTLVEIAALDRSGGADTDAVLSKLLNRLQEGRP
ncbi:cytochrome c biogenesis protein ResB [Nocardioides anomalus]|uniref:Cytochrome c biogenesis protein ResB n=1 Tax=Nocardioides anomalus TaxID=2712223 RepID=A0A6G6WHP4_9ACTN|nr:cytochrome c biogenesis protein ResB [Nocardioides anomalus]QIG44742.1 cytochrome c biogenesis protein ResB [Nocardioides anomalus]